MKGVIFMSRYSYLKDLPYYQLKYELAIAYYSCSHDWADYIIAEMSTRDEYYKRIED
jgi:hypothetical protein